MSRLVKSAEEHINSLVIKQQSATSPQTTPAAAAAAEEDTAANVSVGDITGRDNPDRASTPPPLAAAAAAPAGLATPTQPAAAAAAAAARAESPPPLAIAPDSKSQAGSPAEQQRLPVDTAVFARTRMALQTWDTLCNNASTPSTVLPATNSDLVRALQVRERWAKIVGVQHAAAAPDGTAAAVEQVTPQQQQQHSVGDGITAAVDSTAAAVASEGSKQQRQHEVPEIEQLDAAAVKKQRC